MTKTISLEEHNKQIRMIFDELYFGETFNSNIQILVVGETPCLQHLAHGGAGILKHEYLVKSVEGFIAHFHKVSSNYKGKLE